MALVRQFQYDCIGERKLTQLITVGPNDGTVVCFPYLGKVVVTKVLQGALYKYDIGSGNVTNISPASGSMSFLGHYSQLLLTTIYLR